MWKLSLSHPGPTVVVMPLVDPLGYSVFTLLDCLTFLGHESEGCPIVCLSLCSWQTSLIYHPSLPHGVFRKPVPIDPTLQGAHAGPCLSPQEIPCGLEAVTESRGAELGAAVGWVGVLTTGLLGLVDQTVLGVAGAGASVGARGLLAMAIAPRIQSRSRVTRA